MSYSFTLNGQRVSVDVEPDMPLLWALRDELGLMGTKFGCGAALCGACTVHVNGVPERSCALPVAQVAGKAVVTIEGVGGEKIADAVRAAWIRHQVPQCGYCQPGEIMSAVALLASKKAPTDADIDQAMAGNLCRCGTYARIRVAIHAAAKALA